MGIHSKTFAFTLVVASMPFLSAKADDNQKLNTAPQSKVEELDSKKPPLSTNKTDGEIKQQPQPVNVNQANRYVLHFLAWIDEPYIAYRAMTVGRMFDERFASP